MNLLLWKLLINACMRDLWVRHELIQGMLLRSLGSFLRGDKPYTTITEHFQKFCLSDSIELMRVCLF